MMNWLIKQFLKLLSYDSLVEIIATSIAYILDYARTNTSPDTWEKAKMANKQIKNWTTLFDEVYEDDNLTEEEEKKIQEAIAGLTATESIYKIITGKKKTTTKGKATKRNGKSK